MRHNVSSSPFAASECLFNRVLSEGAEVAMLAT